MGKSNKMKKYDIVSYMGKDRVMHDAAITGFNMDGTVDVAYVQLYDGKNVRVIYEQDVEMDRITGRKSNGKSILPFKQNSLVRYHVDEDNYFAASILQVGVVDSVRIRLGDSYVTTAATNYHTGDEVDVNVRDIYLVDNVFEEYDRGNPKGRNSYEPAEESILLEKKGKMTKSAKSVIILLVICYCIMLAGSFVFPYVKLYLNDKKIESEENKLPYDTAKWSEYGDILRYRNYIQNPENLGPVEFALSLYYDKDFSKISAENLSAITQVEISMDEYNQGEHYQYRVNLFDKRIEKMFQMSFSSSQAIDTYNFAMLPNLSRLSIEADSLKTISFLEEMSSLTTFELEAEDLTDLSPLAKSHIEELNLYLKGEDIEGVGQPILEMQYLKKLLLRNAAIIFQDVEGNNESVLEIECGYAKEYTFLQHFSNLERLDIQTGDMIIARDVKTIGAENLQHLKYLNLTGIRMAEDFSGFLNLPNIEEVYLEKCVIAMSFDNIKENSNLKTLQWKESTLLEDVRDYEFGAFYDVYGEESSLADHMELLKNYPNLTNLAIVGEKMESLDPVLQFPNLEVLDISDNSIKSLAPLKELNQLKELKVTNNPLGGDALRYGLPDTVQIVE